MDINFEEKKQHIKKWLKILTCHRKFEFGIEKINYDAVEKSQSKLKKFEAINVGLYIQGISHLQIKQQCETCPSTSAVSGR